MAIVICHEIKPYFLCAMLGNVYFLLTPIMFVFDAIKTVVLYCVVFQLSTNELETISNQTRFLAAPNLTVFIHFIVQGLQAINLSFSCNKSKLTTGICYIEVNNEIVNITKYNSDRIL